MNPSPCLTAGSNQNVELQLQFGLAEKCAQRMQTARNVRKFVNSLISSLKFSAAWFGEMLRRMRNREERRSDTPFSSLQHFKKVGFGDVQVGDDCRACCYAFPVFKPAPFSPNVRSQIFSIW